VNGGLRLVSTTKYLNRQRGFTPGLSFELTRDLWIESSATLNDIFKGNLTETRIVDEGLDLIPQISLIYDGIRVERDESGFFFSGLYGEITYSVRLREFSDPISSKLENRILAKADIREIVFIEEEFTFNTPIAVWEHQQIDFYSLGGFGGIRGYDPDSIFALRFLRSALDVEQHIFRDAEISLTTSKKKGRSVRIHEFALLYIHDLLLSQGGLDLGSPIGVDMSAGAGFAFTFSGRRDIHFKTQVYAAQAIGKRFSPIFYLRTSLFNLETRPGR
jgi:hypothetical protein